MDPNIGTWTIKFGKYKGKMYSEIVGLDPSYVEWLIKIIKNEPVKQYLSNIYYRSTQSSVA